MPRSTNEDAVYIETALWWLYRRGLRHRRRAVYFSRLLAAEVAAAAAQQTQFPFRGIIITITTTTTTRLDGERGKTTKTFNGFLRASWPLELSSSTTIKGKKCRKGRQRRNKKETKIDCIRCSIIFGAFYTPPPRSASRLLNISLSLCPTLTLSSCFCYPLSLSHSFSLL